MATAAQGAQRVLWALLVATLGGAAHAAEPSQTVDALVVQLKSEAKQVPLERASETSDAPQFAMPHRTLPRSRSARPELAEEAARALLRFNGDQLGDRYVRFHLLGAMADGLKSKSGPPHDAVAPEVGRAAAQVLSLDRAAEHLRGDFEIDTYREPKDVFERWDNLEDDLSIAVGVPPFQRWVKGEAAMRVASPRQRERLEAVMAERAQLERRLAPNYTKDRAADARNERRKRLNWLLRDQRATAAEILISYGDAKVLASTISSAVQAAEGGQQAGFDVLDAMVRQLAEGRADLSRFGRPDLEAIARPLERASRGAGRWSYPKEGETPLQWARSTRRNVADLAASLDLYFRYPAISASLAQGSGATPRMALPQRASSSSFSLDAIERSVATARPVINDVFGRGEAVERMRVELRPVRYNQLLNRNSWAQRQREIGTQAALAWAMIGAGQPSQSPGLQHRVHVALAGDTPRTFDLAMRVLMTARLPGSVYEPLLRRQVDTLLNGMSQQGGWGKTVHDDAGWGDHAHAMYVAYALDAADRAGLSIPRDVWVAIDRHWRATQESTPGDSPAGWRVLGAPFGKEPANATVDAVSVAPTAGGVAALSIVDRALNDGSEERRRAIDKGIAWLDQNFSTAEAPGSPIDWYFVMWTMQRVGKAAGRSIFNDVDWFREVTPLVIDRQQAGTWYSSAFRGDASMPTAMAMLYLAEALDPVAVARVEHDFGWDEEMTGLSRFTQYASDRYEHNTTWTTTSLSRPLGELMSYPMLFVSATEALNFTAPEVAKLRDYVAAGGLLLLNPSDPSTPVGRSFKALLEKIAPGREMATIEPDDTIYDIHREVRPSVRMQAVGSAVRPWAIWFIKDLNEDLATGRGESDAMVTLSNLYLYRVGRNPRRTRLDSPHLPAITAPARRVSVARLTHDGDYDPEPAALDQLGRYLVASHGTGLDVSTVAPGSLSDSVDVAFLTTTGDGSLGSAEAEAIRRWCEAGGTLMVDAAGGSAEAVDAARAMLSEIFPDQTPLPISPASPILTGRGLPLNASDRSTVEYRLYTLQQGVLTDRPRLSTIEIDGRDAVIFSAEDLTTGWAGLEHWGINGYSIDDARGLGANAVLAGKR